MKTTSMLRLILGAAFALVVLGGAVAQADTLDDIKKADRVRNALDLAIPPFGMSDDEMRAAGSDVDLVRLLSWVNDWVRANLQNGKLIALSRTHHGMGIDPALLLKAGG